MPSYNSNCSMRVLKVMQSTGFVSQKLSPMQHDSFSKVVLSLEAVAVPSGTVRGFDPLHDHTDRVILMTARDSNQKVD